MLRRRADDLVAVDRNKDEFLAMLAHELRNPLAPLHNVVTVLRADRDDPARFDRALDIIQRQVGNMARLLDDLPDVSRMTLGQIELQREVVDVATIAAHAADVCRPAVEQRAQRLTVSVQGPPLRVYADSMRMEQVLGNLLSNASKYTPRGGHITLTISEAPDAAGQPHGFDAARALRRIPGLEKTTLIALSGYGHDEARQRAREAAFDHYLTKPAGAEAIQAHTIGVVMRHTPA